MLFIRRLAATSRSGRATLLSKKLLVSPSAVPLMSASRLLHASGCSSATVAAAEPPAVVASPSQDFVGVDAATRLSSSAGPVELAMREKLAAAFKPTHLEVINESHRHNVPAMSETHFKCVVISDQFEKKTLIDRHRFVNAVLADELGEKGGVHALSIVAKTPEQWSDMAAAGKSVGPSPNCRGGDGSLSSRNS